MKWIEIIYSTCRYEKWEKIKRLVRIYIVRVFPLFLSNVLTVLSFPFSPQWEWKLDTFSLTFFCLSFVIFEFYFIILFIVTLFPNTRWYLITNNLFSSFCPPWIKLSLVLPAQQTMARFVKSVDFTKST